MANLRGLFLSTTEIIDPRTINDLSGNSEEFRYFLVSLYNYLNKVATVLNVKDSGYYIEDEFITGQKFFSLPVQSLTVSKSQNLRDTFRTAVNFGQLPNAGLKSVPHNIPINAVNGPFYIFTRIYATASDTTGFNYIPIPFASTVLANNIEITVDAVNVNITTGSNRTNFNECYVILEYIKS